MSKKNSTGTGATPTRYGSSAEAGVRVGTMVPVRPPAAGSHVVSDPHWFRRAVFYELSVRGFYDASGDGNGDLRGLIEKLEKGIRRHYYDDKEDAVELARRYQLARERAQLGAVGCCLFDIVLVLALASIAVIRQGERLIAGPVACLRGRVVAGPVVGRRIRSPIAHRIACIPAVSPVTA